MPSPSTPDFLRGSWKRNWIKRAAGPKPGDEEVIVCYVQSGYWFVDVRGGAAAGNMSFAGVTTVSPWRDSGHLVRWHALMEHGEGPKGEDAWDCANKGEPEDTEDTGLFERKGEEGGEEGGEGGGVWAEKAEDGSLEEEWVKGGSAGDSFAAIKWGVAIFVIAGGKFAFADAERDLWCAGSASDLKVEVGINVAVGADVASVIDSDGTGWKAVEGDEGDPVYLHVTSINK